MRVARVLLVDDSKVSRTIGREIVTSLGHEVIAEAINGNDGFAKYQELKPDVVLSDVEMPECNGHEMVEKIIEFDPEATIIMVTSVVNAQFIQKIINEGAKYAVKKPINKEKIQKVFQTVGIL